jgi:hypothetical protein
MATATKWLEKHWWGVLIAYPIIFASVYLIIWSAAEPLGIPEKLEALHLDTLRIFYHIVATLLISSHTILILEIYLKKKHWAEKENAQDTNKQIIETIKELGITSVLKESRDNKNLSAYLIAAKKIRVMSVSGQMLIRSRKTQFMEAISSGADIKILIATPLSQLVVDIEEAESQHRSGEISSEIYQVKKLLREYVDEAAKKMSGEALNRYSPKIYLGHFGTHLRASIIMCDDKWTLLTLNLPPKRSVETVSFELVDCNNGLMRDVVCHFDKAWEFAANQGNIIEICS